MDNKLSVSKKNSKLPKVLKIIFPVMFLAGFMFLLYFLFLPKYGKEFFNVNTKIETVELQEIQSAIPESTPDVNNEQVQISEPSENDLTEESNIEGSYESSSYALLSLNDNHPSVEKLQLRLMELGYLESDEPGTIYNEATQSAVAMFQRAIDAVITGIADVSTQESLFNESALPYEVKSGSSGNDIKSMQVQLNTLGYYTSKINGYFGTATEDALISFQKKNSLDNDGIYNIDDRDLLYSENARPLIEETPAPKKENKNNKDTNSKTTKKSKSSSSDTVSKSNSDSESVVVIRDDVAENVIDNTSSGSSNDNAVIIEDDVPVIQKSFNATGDVEGVISCAEAQLGKKYVGGDEGPDTFDCSGLVYYCLTQNGVNIKRRSAASYAESSSWELISSRDDLKRGDLLFYKNDSSSRVSHTAIYIGNGMMIDASSSNGKVVKRSCTTGYWVRNFVCGRRVF